MAGLLHWPRDRYVAVWAIVGLLVCLAAGRALSFSWRKQFGRRQLGGVIVGAVAGALLVVGVLRRPGSAHPAGTELLKELLWSGMVYGAVDAIVLAVLPVIALYGARPPGELALPGRRLRWAGVALLGSTAVTAAYHLGFPEFRGASLIQPLAWNAIITVAYLLSGSPLAPVVAQVMMHVAAVLHGAAAYRASQ